MTTVTPTRRRLNAHLTPPIFTISALLVGLVILALADVAYGSVAIPLEEVFRVLSSGQASQEVWTDIITEIRIPKTITALLAGMALSVSGLLLQTLFRNPLAGPSVLGISAGASLGVATLILASGQSVVVTSIGTWGVGQGWLLVLASSIGAASVLMIILLISLRVNDNMVLLIIGIMIGNVTLSVVSIWQFLSQPEQIREYLLWTLGSLGNVSYDQLILFSTITLLVVLASFMLTKNLNGLLLGEQYAQSLGIPLLATRLGIILTTSLLVGVVTGFCGPIGFIGIAVPHLVRSVMNTSDHRWLIPGCCLAGGLLLIACDLLSQWPGKTWVLPINAITALIGSPVVIWVILRRRNLSTHFH